MVHHVNSNIFFSSNGPNLKDWIFTFSRVNMSPNIHGKKKKSVTSNQTSSIWLILKFKELRGSKVTFKVSKKISAMKMH